VALTAWCSPGECPVSPVLEPAGPAVVELFGDSWQRVARYAEYLAAYGEERGLIGPHEVPRLWNRHIVNSAAVAEFLPASGAVADVGSGAGLPGAVLAAMRPDLRFHLIEPMQRRADWLREVSAWVPLPSAVVHQARAEDVRGLAVDVVTARAVAPLERLAGWSLPLLRVGGRLVLLKGRRAADEVSAASADLARLGVGEVRVHEVDLLGSEDVTYVVEAVKVADLSRPGPSKRRPGRR